MANGDIRQDMPSDDGFAEEGSTPSGMLIETLRRIDRRLQMIDPEANEQGIGNLFPLGLHTTMIAPYDRERVRVTLFLPQTAPPPVNGSNIPEGAAGSQQTGVVFIGRGETVRAGGGFMLTPGTVVQIETVAALVARATMNPTYLSVFIERQGGDSI